MRILVAILLTTLAGCSLLDKPNNALAFTSDQILNLAVQVERAQASHVLSEEDGDEYLGLLIQANGLLGGAVTTFGGIEVCKSSETKMQCIDAILIKVEGAL